MSIEQAMGVYNDPRLAGLGTDQSQQVLNYLFDNAVTNDPLYVSMDMENKRKFKEQFLRQRPRALENYQPQNDVEEALLNDTRSRGGRLREAILGSPREFALETLAQDKSRENAFGLTGAFRNLAGKFSERAFEAQGGELTQIDEVNPDVYRYAQVLAGETLNNRGLSQTEQKMQTIGNALSIVGDMVIANGLYGSVRSGGGALTAPLYQSKPIQALVQLAKSPARGLKIVGKGGIIITEALAEGLGYVGEEAIAAKVSGREVDPFIKSFFTGVALNGAFNVVGDVGARLLGIGKNVFTLRGARGAVDETITPVQAIQRWIIGDDGVIEKEVIESLRARGFDNSEIESLQRARTRVKEVYNRPELFRDKDTATAYVFNQQFDADLRKVQDGWNIRMYDGAKFEPMTFKSLDDLNQRFNIVQTKGWQRIAEQSSQYFGDVKVNVNIDGNVNSIKLSKDSVIQTFVKQGDVDEIRIQRFLDESGIKKKAVKDVDYFKKKDLVNDDSILIPSRISSNDESVFFARNFMKSIGETNPNDLLSYIRKVGRSLDYSLGSLKKIAKGQKVKLALDGRISVGEETFESVNHAMAELQSRQFPEAHIIKELGERDIYVARLDDSTIEVKFDKNGQGTTYSDFADMFLKSPETRLAGRIEDSFSAIAPDLGFRDSVTVATGGMSSIRAKLDQYKVRNRSYVKNVSGDRIFLDNLTKKYVVEFGDSGITLNYDSFGEASRAAQRGLKSLENLQEVAELRGYKIVPTEYGYILKGNGEMHTFSSRGKLDRFLGKQEALLNLREFTGASDADIRALNDQLGESFDKIKKKTLKQLDIEQVKSTRRGSRQFLSNVRRFIEPMRERFRKTGDTKAYEIFERLSLGHKRYEQQYFAFVDQTNRIFDKVSMKENQDMFDVFSAEKQPNTWFNSLREMGYSDDRANVLIGKMQEVRQVFDLLGENFGISQDIYITNYASRLREADLSKFQVTEQIDHRSILDPDKVNIKDLDFYARNLRVEDYMQARDGSLKSMLEIYARSGFKEQQLGSTMTMARNYANSIDNREVKELLNDVTNRSAGRLFNEERLQRALRKRISNEAMIKIIDSGEGRYSRLSDERKAALKQRIRTRDSEFLISSVINASVMAFKLRLPLRNVSQIFTTTASTFGIEHVWDAMGDVYKNGEALYREAALKNIVQNRDPKTMYDYLSWMTNTSRSGTIHFKNSDDFNRIVSMRAAQMKFDEGLNGLRNGEINMDRFMDFTGAKLLDESDKLKFIGFMESGDMGTARNLMEQRAVEWTQFDYSSINKPQGQTTAMGKLLGQYSTYSIGYYQMIARNLRSLDPIQSAAFVARLAINTYGVYFLYNELIGIQGMPMNPLGTLAFTGGPMLGSTARIYNTATSMNMSAGQKAMQIATKDATAFYPYYGMARKSLQAVESIIEHDYYNATIYAIGGTPTED